jgi:23S rRNA (cytosine1962-C5)-methyltransferase
MVRARRTPQRYQLNKHALQIVEAGHPWLFRDQLSSAAGALADGQWLRLVDGQNRVVGHGIHEAEGAIGVRVIARGDTRPDAAHFGRAVDAALARREALRAETDAFRAIHGESDGLPAVVIDVFAQTVVLQTYSLGSEALGRWAAARVARAVGATAIVDKPAQRRRRGKLDDDAPRDEHGEPLARVLRGRPDPEVTFREGALTLTARPLTGQKSGTFLDLRGLRRRLATMTLDGARVLNLFAYTGTLGLACEHAGAKEILQVDRAMAALELAEAAHTLDKSRHTFLCADIFSWLPALDRSERFDVVIVDPPSMTSRMDQVQQVLSSYKRLYKRVAPHVPPGGLLVAACCTSRVSRQTFITTVGSTLGSDFRLEADLPPEPDHPVAFREADYLKVTLWRRNGAAR